MFAHHKPLEFRAVVDGEHVGVFKAVVANDNLSELRVIEEFHDLEITGII